ncbi:4-hydroxy-tetrahydrodipicolinate synthase [Spirochaetota bacterium]|nr:4-hydroxy-tetrahydrodipicolinate synthase [Spirochaetota bacterium]
MKGCFTALMTPFKNGAIDYASFEKLIASQIEAGIDGIVPCGTTGESPTLSHQEHNQVVEFTITQVKNNFNGAVKVIAGTGSNATQESLNLSRHAAKCGADGLLVVSPYYNKPSQEGLFHHYKSIIEAVSCEIVIYNIPGRTSVNIDIETFKRLATLKNFNTVKEATGSIDFASKLINAVPTLDVISGNDSLNLPMASIGGVGCISVLSNLFPKEVKNLFSLYNSGHISEATSLHHKLLPLTEALFIETNPVPVKTAAVMMKLLATAEVRLPLVQPSQTVSKRIAAELERLAELK